jgi:hypothetical protein
LYVTSEVVAAEATVVPKANVLVVEPNLNFKLVPSYHISPSVGDEGAVPEVIRNEGVLVVEAVVTKPV